MIPRDVVASGDPAKIRSYLQENSLGDLPVEVRDLTASDFENFNRIQGERSAEVQRGLSDLTNDQGVSPFAQAIDESPLPRLLGLTGVPGVFRSIREAATAGESQGGFIGGLSKLALAVTPDWDIGRKFAEATGTTTGKTLEQLLRGVGQAASLTGSAAIAGADANLPGTTSGLVQGLAGHALRSGGRWLTDMMDVPGPQDVGEVGETYRRAGFLPAALATGELMARGITENAPQMAAAALFPPLAVSPEAAPIIRWLANLAPFAITAFPQEAGDIYERAIDEGRQGPQAALAALAGGGINALLEAGPEAWKVGHLLGQQVMNAADKPEPFNRLQYIRNKMDESGIDFRDLKDFGAELGSSPTDANNTKSPGPVKGGRGSAPSPFSPTADDAIPGPITHAPGVAPTEYEDNSLLGAEEGRASTPFGQAEKLGTVVRVGGNVVLVGQDGSINPISSGFGRALGLGFGNTFSPGAGAGPTVSPFGQ